VTIDLNLSAPAESQIYNFTVFPNSYKILVLKSNPIIIVKNFNIPIVANELLLKRPSVNLTKIDDFPTAALPIIIYFSSIKFLSTFYIFSINFNILF
jgi:hypothetical protein